MKKENFTILIVDDEEIIRKALAKNYKLDGYNVIMASGGNEAVELCRNKKIDFVISDVRMPEGDGVFLLDELRKMNPDIPVIVMITGFSELTKEEAISKGALDLLNKPVDFKIVDAYIENYIKDNL
jgi:DNA-binding NtrC family response regulator